MQDEGRDAEVRTARVLEILFGNKSRASRATFGEEFKFETRDCNYLLGGGLDGGFSRFLFKGMRVLSKLVTLEWKFNKIFDFNWGCKI